MTIDEAAGLGAAGGHGTLSPIGPLYQLSRAVSAAGDLDSIFDAALCCLNDCLDIEKSSILLFDTDGVMRFRGWRNLSATYRAAVEGHSPWSIDTVEPEPVVVPNVDCDPGLEALSGAIRAEGIKALAFVPLSSGGKLLGKFMLYYPEEHFFDEDELMVARTIAAYVAFAIDQHAVQGRLQLYRRIFEASQDGIAILDPSGHYIEENAAHEQLLGYSLEEMKGATPAMHLGQEAYAR